MAKVFIMDVLLEESAKILQKYINK